MKDLSGHSLGRYRIAEKIGEGGMGVVYRAHDTRLDRDVAIKVLPGARTNNPSQIERFKREARAVARLSHPNILEIFDFGEDGDFDYAVMELLHGSDLRSKVRSGRIPVRKAIQIAQQAADGLGAAHRAGVIHRDIKPENLFLTRDGRLKILDFGLAHLKDPVGSGADPSATTDILTGKGTVLGTPQYMSPEQIRGQKVDTASDIFSLGCVIYEMIGGVHPFIRGTSADTLSAILSEDPEPLAAAIPDLPVAVDELILRCLEKEAANRLESARDLGFALEAISESRSVSGRLLRRPPLWTRRGFRIAVVSATVAAILLLGGQAAVRHFANPRSLPDELYVGVPVFQSFGGGEELQQLAAGLSRSVVDSLESLESEVGERMWVVPQTTAIKLEAEDCSALHRVFNVTVCVTGELRRSADRLTLTLKVVDASTGEAIGSKSIEDDWGNLAIFQAAPVRETAALLGLSHDAALSQTLARTNTNVTPALVAYLRGSGLLLIEQTETSTHTAVDLLKQSTLLDPLNMAAWETMAIGYRRLFEQTENGEWLDDGMQAIAEPIDRSPTARAFVILSMLRASAGDTDGRTEALEDAVEIEPENAEAHYELSRAYRSAQRTADAELEIQKAMNLRPRYWPYHNMLASIYFSEARYDAAANQWRLVTQYAPSYADGHANLGTARWVLGDEAGAEVMFRRSIELRPDRNYVAYSNLGTLYYGQARFADAADMYQKALAEDDSSYILWGNLGFAHAYGASPELAVEPLRRAISLAEADASDDPDDISLIVDLASYYAYLEIEDEARRHLDAAIALDPSNPFHLLSIGEAYKDIGERGEAIGWIRRALDAGLPEEQLESRPELRDLISEPRLGPSEAPPPDSE